MTISTGNDGHESNDLHTENDLHNGKNQTPVISGQETGGILADALTLTRALLTPIIMIIIIKGWPENQMALLASFMFAIAAISDLLDDMIGGPDTAPYRKFGWFDDIADTILVVGTLAALLYVTYEAKILTWPFAIPALIIIIREVGLGLFKSKDLISFNLINRPLGILKNGLAMLGTCILVATPWLTTWVDSLLAGDDPTAIYDHASPVIWLTGEVILWAAAGLAIITAVQHFKPASDAANDG